MPLQLKGFQILLLIWIAVVGITLCRCDGIAAQSIRSNASPKYANLFQDLRSQQPGDLIVVTVDQSTDVQNRDQRQLNKQGSAETSGNSSFGLTGIIGTATGGLENESDSSAKRRFNGDTQLRKESDIIDRLTVTVIDRLPNDNLLIAGKRRVAIDGDSRVLVLTGVVRAIDVAANNTISSRLISQLEIQYESDGTESKFLNQGWLGKRLNRLWPF